MYSVDPRVLLALGASRGAQGRLWASINGSPFGLPLPLVKGTGKVQVDGTAAVRRSLSAEVAVDADDPAVSEQMTEVRAEYGVTIASGVTLWVPVFTGPIMTRLDAGLPGHTKITANDRWQRVVDARFPLSATTSGNVAASIKSLVEGADSRITCDISGAPSGTGPVAVWDRNRDDAVAQLARSIGARVVFGPDGNAKVLPIAHVTDPVQWQISRGQGGAKISSVRGADRSRTYNAVVCVGEPPNGIPPAWAMAYDATPGSRTYYGGPFGKRVRFYQTALVTTNTQAAAAAAGLLSAAIGEARSLAVTALPHPGLDADDVVMVEVTPGAYERHIVDGFTIPLGIGGGVKLTTRGLAALPNEGA